MSEHEFTISLNGGTRSISSTDVSTVQLFSGKGSGAQALPVGYISRPPESFGPADSADADDALSAIASEAVGGSAGVQVVDLMDWLLIDDNEHERSDIAVDVERHMTVADHDLLVYHLRTLLDTCDGAVRAQLLARMDRVQHAFEARSSDGNKCNDEGEQQNNNPTNNHNDYLVMPFVHPKVIDTATVLANILFPPTEMYSAISRKDKQSAAKALSTAMSRDAKTFGHFSQLFAAVVNLVRYNVAAVHVTWSHIEGQQLIADEATGKVVFTTGVLHSGNSVVSLDPHNIYWDVNCLNFQKLDREGQFVAVAETESLFQFVKNVRDGKYFGSTGVDVPVASGQVIISSYPGYYHRDPVNHSDFWELAHGCCGVGGNEVPGGSRLEMGSDIDWHSEALSAGLGGPPGAQRGQLHARGRVELVRAYVRMRGVDFGFVGDGMDAYAVWEIVMLNGRRIVLAKPESVPHGRFPIQIASLLQDDESILREKSLAELMVPFQSHMQDIVNKLQQTLKKGLAGGLTIYDGDKVELDRDKNPITGYVKAKNLPGDQPDIRKHIMQLNNLPDSTNALSHIDSLMRLLENVIPTQQAQQVADLQRATEFQAAATVAASAKRHLTVAKLVDERLFMPLRHMQFYNLLAHGEPVEIIDEQGEVQAVTPAQLAGAGLEFDISQGLLGMDRLILSSRYFQLLNLIVQGNMAMQVDFLGMLNYYTSLIGDPTDFNMFKVKTPFDNLAPEQKAAAFQLLQQVGAGVAGNNGQGTVPSPGNTAQ